MTVQDECGSAHTANILGALAVLIQDRVEGAWQASRRRCDATAGRPASGISIYITDLRPGAIATPFARFRC